MRTKAFLLVPVSVLSLSSAVHPQDSGAIRAETRCVLEQASPEARELWRRLILATGGGEERAPIHAFHLVADGLRRDGVRTNEVQFDYRYLAPDCIRFALDGNSETGRCGTGARDYWVRTKEGVTPLVGRDYASDREQVKRMHAIARNFVALSDPANLRVERLELLPGPPADLEPTMQRVARRMPWLRIASPDFALFTDQVAEGGTRSFLVDLALQIDGEERDLPRYAIVREAPREGVEAARPMFIRLDGYRLEDDFRIPMRIFVHDLDPGLEQAVFSARASQEVYVIEADLRPAYTVEDFRPTE